MIKGCPTTGLRLLNRKAATRAALCHPDRSCWNPVLAVLYSPQSISSTPAHPLLVRLFSLPLCLEHRTLQRMQSELEQLTPTLHKGKGTGMPRHPLPAHTHIYFLPHKLQFGQAHFRSCHLSALRGTACLFTNICTGGQYLNDRTAPASFTFCTVF